MLERYINLHIAENNFLKTQISQFLSVVLLEINGLETQLFEHLDMLSRKSYEQILTK